MKTYVHVKLRMPGGKTRTTWALDLGLTPNGSLHKFRTCDKEGDELNELIVAMPTDIVFMKPAQFNRTYATLEVL